MLSKGLYISEELVRQYRGVPSRSELQRYMNDNLTATDYLPGYHLTNQFFELSENMLWSLGN
jgi:hypothetical protein